IGKGSEFVIKLPVAETRPDVQAAPKTAPAALEGRRILIVDENYEAAASFASLLTLMHNEVRTAASGTEALRVAKEYRDEVVMLVIGLAGMDGYEVVRALRAENGKDGAMVIAGSGSG